MPLIGSTTPQDVDLALILCSRYSGRIILLAFKHQSRISRSTRNSSSLDKRLSKTDRNSRWCWASLTAGSMLNQPIGDQHRNVSANSKAASIVGQPIGREHGKSTTNENISRHSAVEAWQLAQDGNLQWYLAWELATALHLGTCNDKKTKNCSKTVEAHRVCSFYQNTLQGKGQDVSETKDKNNLESNIIL